MTSARHEEWLRNQLAAVAGALGAVELRLTGLDADAERRSLRETILTHLLPRSGDPESPLVVAVVGPAGGGKSSLVNALAEARLCPTGAIRPGTKYPVLWCDGPLSEPLEALRAALGGVALAGERRAPERMVVVDAPPPDVVGSDGTRPVDVILDAADACVFVTGALRYADASGWDLLDVVARRGIPTVFVLNKLPADPDVQRQVREDMARRLAGRGLIARSDPEEVVAVPATTILRAIGGPAPQLVAAVRKELDAIADPQARLVVSADVVDRGLEDAAARLASVRSAVVEERSLRLGLAALADEAYAPAVAELRAGAEEGVLSDVSGDIDRLVSDLVVITTLRAGRAARAASDVWALHPVGSRVIGEHTALWAHGPDTVASATAAIRGWLDSLSERVLVWLGKRRMGRRRLRGLSELVRRAAVDRTWVPGRRDLRRLEKVDGAVIAARRDLAERLEGVLASDAARFAEALGPPIPPAVIERLAPPEEEPRG